MASLQGGFDLRAAFLEGCGAQRAEKPQGGKKGEGA